MPFDIDRFRRLLLQERKARIGGREKLAVAAGVHKTTIQNIELGPDMPGIDTVAKLIEAMPDLSLSDFFLQLERHEAGNDKPLPPQGSAGHGAVIPPSGLLSLDTVLISVGPDPLPRGIAYDLIEKALTKLPRCKTRARLAVMAYTGLRQGQVMKLTPDHWDDQRASLTVPGTGKGRGTKPYVIPLSEAAQSALRLFETLDAWGTFTWAPMARMWKAAATKAKLPAGTVPYDLRHSFGTAIYRATGDLKATKELMGHSSLRMTERYMLAAVPERQTSAVSLAFVGRKLPVAVARRRKVPKKP